MARVLFVTSPNITIFQKKLFQELSWGASLVAGALEHHGFDVEFYDLNAALAKRRNDVFLNKTEEGVLTNPQQLIHYIRNPHNTPTLDSWIEMFLDMIGDFKRFDIVGISMDKIGYDSFLSRGTFHFMNILADRIKKRTGLKVVAGGKFLLKDIGQSYAKRIIERLGTDGVDCLFTNTAHETFPQELKKYFSGYGELYDGAKFIDEKSLFRHSNVVPKYDIANREDIFVTAEELFLHSTLKKYPQLKDTEPLAIVPYRFSWGCPYKCAFCTSGEDRTLRLHDTDDIVHSLHTVAKKGFKNFRWYNDNVNLGSKFPVQLSEKIIESGMDIFFSDSANMIHTSDEVMSKLKQAGCIKLWFGCETLSERLLVQNNKQATLKDFYRTVETAQRYDIWTGLFLILSFPHETLDEFELTYNFVKDRTDLYDCIEVNIFRLLSGTTYAMYPEKFNLRINRNADNGMISTFDEIGGMEWDVRIKEANRRLGVLRDLYPLSKLYFFQNDYLFFFLMRSGFTKKQAKSIMIEMYDELYLNREDTNFSYKIDRDVEPSRRVFLGSHIMGRIIDDGHENKLELSQEVPY